MTSAVIIFGSDETTITLQFDLAIDINTCDTTQLSLQAVDGTATFTPTHRSICTQPQQMYHTSNSQEGTLTFTLSPTDHILLHQTNLLYLLHLVINSVAVSIGSTFVYTGGLAPALPVYFTDNFIAEVHTAAVQISSLDLELDMASAEFNILFDGPVTVNNSQIQLSCNEDLTQLVTVSGLWSSPLPIHDNTTKLSMRISPVSFSSIIHTLYCLNDNSVILYDISSVTDVLGSTISLDTTQVS